MKIRMSSLPRVLSCHASAVLPDIDIDTSSDASRMGTACHAVLEAVVRQDLDRLPDNFNEIAQEYNIEDVKEMRILSYVGLNAWINNIKPHIDMNAMMVEERVEFPVQEKDGSILWEVVGHMDLCGVSLDGETLIVNDWKSSRIESDHKAQLKGYAHGALLAFMPTHKNIKKVITITTWLRTQTLDIQTYSKEDILLFPIEVEMAIDSNKYAPTPDNCRFCSNLNCEAKQAMSNDTIGSMLELSKMEAGISVTTKLGKLYPQIQFVEYQAKKARDLVKEHIKKTGQRIPLDNGKYLGIMEQTRDDIDLGKAAPIINSFLSDTPMPTVDAFAKMISPFVTISKSKLMDAVKARSERGEKGRDVMRVMAQLEEHECVNKVLIERLNMFSEEFENE